MTNIVCDVESDGPAPGIHSMVWFGAVLVTPELNITFEAKLAPISESYSDEALAVSGLTREQTLVFPEPSIAMIDFDNWITEHSNGRSIFWSDNNGYDFAFINYYFHRFLGRNPFGWSSQNMNSFYKGLNRNLYASFKHLRKTKHDHNPVNDAMGNAEALMAMAKHHRMRFPRES